MAGTTEQALPVAVIIAAHNRAQWVGRAVESALGQRPRPPAEVIVVDDASTDATAEVAQRAGARVIRHAENRGAAAARNTGVAATTQPWIAPLDSDDRWLPHMLAALWPLRDGYVFVAGASMAVDANDTPVAYGGALAPRPVVLSSPAPLVFPENFVAASGVLVQREMFVKVHGYRESDRSAEDLDLWVRLLQEQPGLSVPLVVTLYGVHAGQKGQRSGRPALDIVTRYRDQPWYTPALAEQREAVLTWDEMRAAIASRRMPEAAARGWWLIAKRSRREAIRITLARRRQARARAVRWTGEAPHV